MLLKLSSIHGWNEKQLELFLAEGHGLRKHRVFSQPSDPLLLSGPARGRPFVIWKQSLTTICFQPSSTEFDSRFHLWLPWFERS